MSAARRSVAAIAAALVATAPAFAQVHRCSEAGGKIVYSDRPCPDALHQRTLPPLPPPASPGRRGMTFGTVASADPAAPVHLACKGAAPPTERGDCDAYGGDAACEVALPVACVDKSVAATRPLKRDFNAGWAGRLGATRPVPGVDLASAEAASARCARELGAGWRMAEFHDGGGGWGLVGERGPGLRNGTRYWVHINDQPANCWDRRAAAATARAPERVETTLQILVGAPEGEQREALAFLLNNPVDHRVIRHPQGRCGTATRAMYQGKDLGGDAWWSVACDNGRSYSIKWGEPPASPLIDVRECAANRALGRPACFSSLPRR